VADDVLSMADAGGHLRALDAAHGGADLLPGPGFIRLTLPFPDPANPGGPPSRWGNSSPRCRWRTAGCTCRTGCRSRV
jgi:hypothetical protein